MRARAGTDRIDATIAAIACFPMHMLAFRRSADIIIYEYALDTLGLYFTMANADVVDVLKTVIARSVVAVSKAAGEGWFGSVGTPSDDQRTCIDTICLRLNLRESKTVSVVLDEIDGPTRGKKTRQLEKLA